MAENDVILFFLITVICGLIWELNADACYEATYARFQLCTDQCSDDHPAIRCDEDNDTCSGERLPLRTPLSAT